MNEETYKERWLHFWHVVNPFNLLTTKSQLDQAKERMLKGEGKLEDLYLIESMTHPDTQETIFWPFRMAAVVPTNIPIILGLIASQSPAGIVFWQWFNQSMNTAVNYANANKSNHLDYQQIALGYGSAVISSCGVALGLNHLGTKLSSPVLRGMSPVLATSLAGVLNVLLMRKNELEQGIMVYDKDSIPLGKSTEAANRALMQVCATRVTTAVGVLTIPQLIMLRISKTFPFRVPLQLAVIGITLQLFLPTSLALFPQRGSFHSKEFNQTVHYNKGL
jgi:sideroflexin-5